jgi:DNA-binding Lrp family transcriptional regulator
MSEELNMSESSVSRRIKQLKKKIMKILWQFKAKKLKFQLLFFVV